MVYIEINIYYFVFGTASCSICAFSQRETERVYLSPWPAFFDVY